MRAVLPAAAHPVIPSARERCGNLWQPVSMCSPECLPDPATLPRVGTARVAVRLAALAGVLALCAAVAALLLPLLGRERRTDVMRGLFRALLRAAGVRVAHSGEPEFSPVGGGGVLVVANHLSWLDVLVLGAVQPLRLVAKREIQGWPVLGALAEHIGTLFIDRAGLRSLPSVVAAVAEALRGGAVVGLFPEGTTWCGEATGPFRRAGFQAALDAGVPVRPVAQRMRLTDGTVTTVGAFIGEDTLLDSMLRVLRLPSMTVEVRVLPLIEPSPGVDRRELARRAELAVAATTGVPAAPAVQRPARTARSASAERLRPVA